jgi:formate dehydrogenase gamma subunit
MTNQTRQSSLASIQVERSFQRFTLGQRWEHLLLMVSFAVLLLTGLPQKYRAAEWSQQVLSSPERVELIRQVHHFFAVILTFEAIYHVGRALYLMGKRKLPGHMLVTVQDVRDAWQMVKYLLFLSKEKPKFGKYNFEQKITYWFLFLGITILIFSGFIIWFPLSATNFLPGGIVPAAKLAHSTEAIVAAIFIVIWHFYHVHIERLNLSIFTGKLSETEMEKFHTAEFEQLTSKTDQTSDEANV